jgi:sialate O-acetylesterase
MKQKTLSQYLMSGTVLIVLLFIAIQPVIANVSMPAIFTDNMVLQQRSDAPVWGKADPGEKVVVTTSWNNQAYETTADHEGGWTVKVKTPAAGFTPYEISVKGKNTIRLKNILIGEVWICSGQSNMEMPLAGWGKVLNYEKEIAEAKYPAIRLLRVANTSASHPQADAVLEGSGWVECSPVTIPEFSSAAYFFARDLLKNQTVTTSHAFIKYRAGLRKPEDCNSASGSWIPAAEMACTEMRLNYSWLRERKKFRWPVSGNTRLAPI